jgi:hypothetical protein
MVRGISRQRTTKRKANAQGLVEFALITPVLLLIIFGIMDFGWMVFNYAQLYNAVREGARFGSVSGFVVNPSPTNPLQYRDCVKIKDTIVNLAGFSGVKRTATTDGTARRPMITVVYDDGRPFDIDAWNALTTIPPSTTAFDSMTAYCSDNLNSSLMGDKFNFATWHKGTENSPLNDRTPKDTLLNGDRIIIQIDVNVQFLTPLIKTFAKGGMNMKFWVGRSIFPNGIQLNPTS